MDESRKAAAGLLYDANHDEQLLQARAAAKSVLFEFNHTPPHDPARRLYLLRSLLGRLGADPVIEAPFHCDYGAHIEIGDQFYANVNLVILDGARVCIGSRVFIGPNCGIYTAGHPLDVERRAQGLEYALPVTIGDDVWLGGGVSVLPGVTIGSGSVIGAGSVVTRPIPAGVLAFGNPCRVVRPIGMEDSQRYAATTGRAGP